MRLQPIIALAVPDCGNRTRNRASYPQLMESHGKIMVDLIRCDSVDDVDSMRARHVNSLNFQMFADAKRRRQLPISV